MKFDTLGIFNYFSPGTYTRKVNDISNERKKLFLVLLIHEVMHGICINYNTINSFSE